MHDIPGLEALLKKLQHEMLELSGGDLEELFRVIHFPGWTTPAEFQLVWGVTESLIAQVNTLRNLQKTLISGAKAVAAKEA